MARASMEHANSGQASVRIVHYHPRAGSGDGGITNSVRRLSEALARAGARPVIVSDADVDPPSLDGVEWRAVRHRRIGPLWIPMQLDRAIEDADLLVLNSAWTLHNALVGRTARRMGVPYVLAPRGAYDPSILRRRRLLKRAWWWAIERRLVQGAVAIHVFFPSQRADLRLVDHDGPVIVAPNGVAVPELRASSRDPAGPYLLYLGRFDPEHKGIDILVRAAAGLPPGRLPPLRLHGPDWVGGKERVRRLIEELGAGDRILIGPAVYDDDKWRLVAGASGFLYPSRWEGFGNAPAEACAYGVPTVVTPYPLGRYLAEHDAAIMARPDVDGLRAALERLCSPEATEIGQRAQRLVRDRFTWDAVAVSWLEQAGEILGTARSRAA
jgi:glycosyltransferase involved in cell wall biosynthesis